MNTSSNPLSIRERGKFLSLIFFPSFPLSNQQHLLLGGSQFLVDSDEVQFTSSGEWPSSSDLTVRFTPGKSSFMCCASNNFFLDQIPLSRLVLWNCIFYNERAHRNKTLVCRKKDWTRSIPATCCTLENNLNLLTLLREGF